MRVEFSGIEFSPDNELNGIAFQGVGRGTQVDHVQAHMSRDDAMEWFGGTVDGKYPSCRMPPTTASTGRSAGRVACSSWPSPSAATTRTTAIEADNNEFNNNALPRSNPQIYNITICGDPDRTRARESCSARPTSAAARRSRSATS